MKGYKKVVFITNLFLVLIVFNWMIAQKEDTISNGELVLLELYPLDPRSLMQGDYMTLRYAMTQSWIHQTTIPNRGYCIVKKMPNNIGVYDRLQAHQDSLATDEIAIKYYKNASIVKIGAESFLFEEGQATTYEKAKYGGLRVANDGSAVLVGLYNENGGKIISNYDIK